MDISIKQRLHQLVDTCDNELLLEEIKVILESGNEGKDWWDELTDEDRNRVMESEVQYGKGDFISHDELIKRFAEWKKK